MVRGDDEYFSETWLRAWLQEAVFGINSFKARGITGRVLNFSQLLAIPSDIWYVQGPPSEALADISSQLPRSVRWLYRLLRGFLDWLDFNLVRRIARVSKRIIANSKYCAKLYTKRGVSVSGVIYPPVDCEFFRPRKHNGGDYVVVYFGKETDYAVVRKLADMGVRMRAFGGKPSSVFSRRLTAHKNIEYVGRISDDELVDLYANALFTLFAFTHEPFGYVPVESMACGTPVLTYAKQGPAECVVDGVSGWLALSREEMVRKALEIWHKGYPDEMRENARERALRFSVERIYEQWKPLLVG